MTQTQCPFANYMIYGLRLKNSLARPHKCRCFMQGMALLGLLGTWIPAWRALSIDPLVLLREE